MSKKAGKAHNKRRRKVMKIILVVLVVIVVAAMFELKIIRLPSCHESIQEEVDWPPTEPGFYEQGSSNSLRPLPEAARLPFMPPTRISLCNEGAQDAEVNVSEAVAVVPATPKFLIIQDSLEGWEFHFYGDVTVPDTGECVDADTENELEGLVVTPDEAHPDTWVWLEPPSALVPGEAYMLTAGPPDAKHGVVVSVGGGE